MKLLLTGEPGVGKSTLLTKVLAELSVELGGVVARELTDSGVRTGFEAICLSCPSKTSVFARKEASPSAYRVACYNVDIEVLDNFIAPEAEHAYKARKLVVFDEIGRMQQFSKPLMGLIRNILDDPVSRFIGTIVKDPEPFSLEFRKHPRVVLVPVTPDNRERLVEVLVAAVDAQELFLQLKPHQQCVALGLMRTYFEAGSFVQISKLFDNALVYLAEERIERGSGNSMVVHGNHQKHVVTPNLDSWSCDCDLANGRGGYEQGECSHIQAVRMNQQPKA